jgi:hypothetical protein
VESSQSQTFKLVLKVDHDPDLRQRVAHLARRDRETRFWNDLRREKSTENFQGNGVPANAAASRARIRNEFAAKLRDQVVEDLKKYYPSATQHVDDIRFMIQDIRGGSLEVLLFVLGFAKLVQATGITPEEFSKYMDIAAPTAMSLIFGVSTGAVVAKASQVNGEDSVSENGSVLEQKPNAEPFAATVPSMTSLYIIPALFAAAAVGALMYAFVQISSRLAEDRAAYSGYLHDEMESIAKERGDIAGKIAALVDQHESILAAAQKALFDDQMALLKNASAAAAARDDTVVDLVKARLIPTPPASEVKPPLTSPTLCVLDQAQVKNIQAALFERFLYSVEPDGIWGDHTENGVRRFQSRMNLPVTGKIDSATALHLGLKCDNP